MDSSNRPAVMDTFVNILAGSLQFWVAALVGIIIGWCWRPRWTRFIVMGIRDRLRLLWNLATTLVFRARRFSLTFSALFTFRTRNSLASSPHNSPSSPHHTTTHNHSSTVSEIRMVDETIREEHGIVSENDLEHFLHLLNGKGRAMTWNDVMERSTSNMAYQAWRLEPETGPMICRSRTVFEDATPELVRDFFWDDEFRLKWDPMLACFKLVQECTQTGTTIVHWIKKFPLFWGGREYVIGRRIWEAGNSFYCVTKGVQYPDLMNRGNLRRVDTYFSSWIIRPVQSRKSDAQTACEVVLIHYEDIGIPRDAMKLAVRLKMWGSVKKLHAGFRGYQLARQLSEAPLSRSAFLASITTKISLEGNSASSVTVSDDIYMKRHRQKGKLDWKWIVVGGTLFIVGLHKGEIVKGMLFGAGQCFARKRQAAQR